MCGRYTHLFTWKQLHRLMSLTTGVELALPLRYNVAPTQQAPVVRQEGGERRVDLLRWGLVPSWAKDPSIGARTINARSETAATTPAFRAAFRARRCLVPASGFYEWQRVEGAARKQAWYITPARGEIFAFGGLWERWTGKAEHEGQELVTFSILTTAANEVVRPIHERMPVVVASGDFDRWLDPGADVSSLGSVLAPCPDGDVRVRRVGARVNSPRVDDPSCIEPLREDGGLWGGGA